LVAAVVCPVGQAVLVLVLAQGWALGQMQVLSQVHGL
jgi:hypothetical protein